MNIQYNITTEIESQDGKITVSFEEDMVKIEPESIPAIYINNNDFKKITSKFIAVDEAIQDLEDFIRTYER